MTIRNETAAWVLLAVLCPAAAVAQTTRPNVFIAISDDQSWPHASAYGSTFVETPAFDRIAADGLLLQNAFCASPGCSPSRAALLTGLDTWQLRHAGTHASYFDPGLTTFADQLQAAGYFVGYAGKGWGPGDFAALGRRENPAGQLFRVEAGRSKASRHAAAFAKFLRARPADAPFCFWFGSHDPHRTYEFQSGLSSGKELADVQMPPFLPDVPEVRSDLLDYAYEIERFDSDLAAILELIEATGELDETLVIVTSDNGMPFPRAKANCYEYGIHVPMAIRWGKQGGGRKVDELVGFTDLTATIYDVTGVDPPSHMPLRGKSVVPLLHGDAPDASGSERSAVYAARERHSSVRFNSLGFPQRAIRTPTHLYIRNFTPHRWPAGAPQRFDVVKYNDRAEPAIHRLSEPHSAYHDIDACPTLSLMTQYRDNPDLRRYLDLAVAHRPAAELFDIRNDPGCLQNLAGSPEHAALQADLDRRLMDRLRETSDPRGTGDGDVWENYPRVSKMRWFPKPAWAVQSPALVPEQSWVELRRPRQ